jgi:hypothetical protein
LRSDVAKRPPSSGTSGRRSGGITGTSRQDHPFRLVAGLRERLDDLQALGELLRLQLGGRLGNLDAQIRSHLFQVEPLSISRIASAPIMAVKLSCAELVLRLHVFVFGQKLAVLERVRPGSSTT